MGRMGRLDIAGARFAAALAELERAAQPLAESRDSTDSSQAKIAALSAERDTLVERIADLEEEMRALEGLTGEVENRLDGAIAEIRVALSR